MKRPSDHYCTTHATYDKHCHHGLGPLLCPDCDVTCFQWKPIAHSLRALGHPEGAPPLTPESYTLIKLSDADARRIAEFAIEVHRYRGWCFSMRGDITDEWGELERLLGRYSKKLPESRLGIGDAL